MHFYYISCEQEPTLVPPTIPINSRAFLFGDHAYEVMRTYSHIPFAVERHFDRMLSSLDYMKYTVFPALDQLKEDLSKILTYAYKTSAIDDELFIRVHFGRGEDEKIGLSPSLGGKPIWCYICAPLSYYAYNTVEDTGVRLAVSYLKRNLPASFSPHAKTGNYANNMLGCIEAKERGFDDAIFLHAIDNTLVEGTTFNVAFIDAGGTLVVPDPHRERRYLRGITLHTIIDTPQSDFEWRFEDISLDDMSKYPYAIILSTIREIKWISVIEDQSFQCPPQEILNPIRTHFRSCVEKDISSFKVL